MTNHPLFPFLFFFFFRSFLFFFRYTWHYAPPFFFKYYVIAGFLFNQEALPLFWLFRSIGLTSTVFLFLLRTCGYYDGWFWTSCDNANTEKKRIKAKQKQKSLWREQTKLFFPRTKSREDNDITRSWIQVNAHPSRDAIRYINENMHETMRLWMDVIMPYKFICFLINRLTFTLNKQIKDTH